MERNKSGIVRFGIGIANFENRSLVAGKPVSIGRVLCVKTIGTLLSKKKVTVDERNPLENKGVMECLETLGKSFPQKRSLPTC